jgi:hypothetical protein
MYIIDFGFDKESYLRLGVEILSSGIKVSDERPNKKSKADLPSIQHQDNKSGGDDNSKFRQVSDNEAGKQKQPVYWSAPPNIDFKRKSQTKLMADARKGYHNSSYVNDYEKVHILDTFEDSDSDDDSFGLKVQMLTGMGNAGQSLLGKLVRIPTNKFGLWRLISKVP